MYNGFVVDKDQLDFVNKDLIGHNILLGAAGTGKTNIAMALLVKLSKKENPGKSLFVSYTKTLVNICKNNNINQLIKETHLFSSDSCDFFTFHSLFSKYFRMVYHIWPRILTGNELLMISSQALNICKNKYHKETNEFDKNIENFLDEIKFIQDFDIQSLEEYENTVRTGQKVKILRKEVRKYYWYVYLEYRKLLEINNYDCDFNGAALLFKDILLKNNLPKYDNIIIDEGQDFPPSIIKALLLLNTPNGLFLYLGDSTQEIYGTKLSWKSLGLNVRNRITRLENNYRNTIEIGNFARDILNSENWDSSLEEVIYPQNMVRNGIKPVLIDFKNEEIELYFLKKILLKLEEEKTCILTYQNTIAQKMASFLNYNGLKTKYLKDNENIEVDENTNIYTCTYHSVKGLEFDNVILMGFDDKFLENIIKWNKDEEQAISLAMRLFYVACTRAKKRLVITYKNNVSNLFPIGSTNYIEVEPEELLSICNQKVKDCCNEDNVVNNLIKSIILKKKELITYFHKAITETERELDIQSPWLTEKVVDELFVDKIERLLQKKISVKILYGIQDDKQTKHKNYSTEYVIKKLNNQLKRYVNFKIEKTNSHGKALLCDDKFAIISSFNWLSYDGASERDEMGCLITDIDEINKLRNSVFNF